MEAHTSVLINECRWPDPGMIIYATKEKQLVYKLPEEHLIMSLTISQFIPLPRTLSPVVTISLYSTCDMYTLQYIEYVTIRTYCTAQGTLLNTL